MDSALFQVPSDEPWRRLVWAVPLPLLVKWLRTADWPLALSLGRTQKAPGQPRGQRTKA